MTSLLERLTPYLDEQEADYPPSLCRAWRQASTARQLTSAEAAAIEQLIVADQDAYDYVLKVRTFHGTWEERARQWREWAEVLIQSVDK